MSRQESFRVKLYEFLVENLDLTVKDATKRFISIGLKKNIYVTAYMIRKRTGVFKKLKWPLINEHQKQVASLKCQAMNHLILFRILKAISLNK